jgi:hypothetical protein
MKSLQLSNVSKYFCIVRFRTNLLKKNTKNNIKLYLKYQHYNYVYFMHIIN